jgi:bifunctional UDP-N-acetylglucosamine pyrophosphorylase/glucosamine-1-phosphate N-acetyltransferase
VSPSAPATVIVLAAGDGTRMASAVPKVLHRLCGMPMLGHVLGAAAALAPGRLIVVVGGRPEVAGFVAAHSPAALVVEQLHRGGTAHAVRLALETARVGTGTVMVLYGDTPLVRPATLARLAAEHAGAGAAATILTALAADPAGYGRVLRDDRGGFAGIVEDADATAAERAITEINTGMYAFDGALLADAVKRVRPGNAQGEEYLTDAVGILRADGHAVGVVAGADQQEIQGVNDQEQLARARRVLNARLTGAALRAGATIADPATTWLDVGVTVAAGSTIWPGTQLEGTTVVGPGASIGPGCVLRDTQVGAGATVIQSVCESAVIAPGSTIGPFAHLAPGPGAQPEGMAPGSGPEPPGGPATQRASRERGR